MRATIHFPEQRFALQGSGKPQRSVAMRWQPPNKCARRLESVRSARCDAQRSLAAAQGGERAPALAPEARRRFRFRVVGGVKVTAVGSGAQEGSADMGCQNIWGSFFFYKKVFLREFRRKEELRAGGQR